MPETDSKNLVAAMHPKTKQFSFCFGGFKLRRDGPPGSSAGLRRQQFLEYVDLDCLNEGREGMEGAVA